MQDNQSLSLQFRYPGFTVMENSFGKGVYSNEPVGRGKTLAVITGRRVHQRTRMTVQVDWTTHVELGHPWELVNHSCDPNCHLAIRRGSDAVEIVTIRDLEAGEELSLDYDLFEYEIHHFPAACCCGSAICRSSIRGYRFLPRAVKEARAALVAEYLKAGVTVSGQSGWIPGGSSPKNAFDPGEAGLIYGSGASLGSQNG